jgi:hypothetical protein
MTWTLRVRDALRLTVWWTSNHFRKARTWSLLINNSTLCIGTTRWWLTWVWRRLRIVIHNLRLTSDKRISSVACWTATDRIMVNDLTLSLNSTSSRARIYTFLIWTSLVEWTFTACDTFWSTCRWRANKSRDTGTNCKIITLTTLWVWTTRRRWAWISFDRCYE